MPLLLRVDEEMPQGYYLPRFLNLEHNIPDRDPQHVVFPKQ